MAQDFTESPQRIAEDLRQLKPGDGGAAILDAVKYSVDLLNQVPKGRQRVLLLISETRDHGSHSAQVDEVVKLIGDSNTVVYALPFLPGMSNLLDTARGANKGEMNAGPDLLAPFVLAVEGMRKNIPKTIAAMTGGEYELFKNRKSFETSMLGFDNHLHSRYLLSFVPEDPHPGWHKIRVRLRNGGAATVLARDSYWAGGKSDWAPRTPGKRALAGKIRANLAPWNPVRTRTPVLSPGRGCGRAATAVPAVLSSAMFSLGTPLRKLLASGVPTFYAFPLANSADFA